MSQSDEIQEQSCEDFKDIKNLLHSFIAKLQEQNSKIIVLNFYFMNYFILLKIIIFFKNNKKTEDRITDERKMILKVIFL